MANEVQAYLRNPTIQGRISELLDKRAGQFTTSLVSAINANKALANCKPETVLNAALTAASMDLPINPGLGFSAIVPYGQEAQFQIMWRGFVQLAQRSGLYQTLSVTEVYDGQLIDEDPLLGYRFDWKKRTGDEVIGYAAFFRLLNGFEKTLYMTRDEVETHAKRFSKTYQRGQGIWKEDFDAMARKTVLKRLISQFGPMSTELQTAVERDQSVIKDTGAVYVDNLSEDEQQEQKAIDAIAGAKDEDQLTDIVTSLPADIQTKVASQAQEKFRELSDGTDNA